MHLERKLTRLQSALSKVTPRRGTSAVALEEASKLVSRIVTNREQAQASPNCAACASNYPISFFFFSSISFSFFARLSISLSS